MNLYVVEARTNGAGAGSLPAVGGLAPPNPPTLAYFQGQNSKFSNVNILALTQGGPQVVDRSLGDTDVLLIYADAQASVQCGQVPGSVQNIAAGIANGVYVNIANFKAP